MPAHGITGRSNARRSLLALAVAALLSLVAAGEARAAGATDLGDAGGSVLPLGGISEDGQVAGGITHAWIDGARRAFVASIGEGMVFVDAIGGTGPTAGSTGVAISGTGMMVGDTSVPRGSDPADVITHAFAWTRDGGMVDLGSLGGDLAGAADVSDDGTIIVGVSTLPDEDALHAFVWTEESGMVELPGLPGATCPTKWCTSTSLVNDVGLVVGSTYGADNQSHAVLWLPNGAIVDLGNFGAGYRPMALNNVGQVVGSRVVGGVTRAFSWTLAGGFVDIAPPLPGQQSSAVDVNDSGQVTGTVNGTPFVWTPAGGLVELGGLDGTPGFGGARGINASGQVVGVSRALDGRSHPFVWTAATGMIDLEELTPGTFSVSAISDSGWIAGVRTIPGSGGQPNRHHVLIWSAADYLPEPTGEPEPGPDPGVTPAAGGGIVVAGAPSIVTPAPPVAASPGSALAPSAPLAAVVNGNGRAAVKTRSRAFAADAGRLFRSLKACSTLACRLRLAKALGAKQRSYAAWVRKDAARPAPCALPARTLGARLRASDTARSELQRAIQRAQRGAQQPLAARTRTLNLRVAAAVASSRLYATACG